MWQIKETILIKCDKKTLWKIWSNPESWPTWDTDVKSCFINGDFTEGTTGTLVPTGGPAVKFKLTEVTPYQSFTDIARLPLAQLIFEHDMQETHPGQIRVTHTVKLTGPLSWFFSKVMGKQIQKGLPQALRNLAAKAEQLAKAEATPA